MNITDLKIVKDNSLVEVVDGIFMLDLPASRIQKLFKPLGGKKKNKADEAKRESEAVNKIFKDLIRDKDGKEFTDLQGKNVADVISVKLLTTITEGVIKELNPDFTKK